MAEEIKYCLPNEEEANVTEEIGIDITIINIGRIYANKEV